MKPSVVDVVDHGVVEKTEPIEITANRPVRISVVEPVGGRRIVEQAGSGAILRGPHEHAGTEVIGPPGGIAQTRHLGVHRIEVIGERRVEGLRLEEVLAIAEHRAGDRQGNGSGCAFRYVSGRRHDGRERRPRPRREARGDRDVRVAPEFGRPLLSEGHRATRRVPEVDDVARFEWERIAGNPCGSEHQ